MRGASIAQMAVSITANTGGFVKGITSAVSAVAGFAGRLASTAAGAVVSFVRGLASVATQAVKVGAILGAIGLASFIGLSQKAAREATDFGLAMAKVSTLLTDGGGAAEAIDRTVINLQRLQAELGTTASSASSVAQQVAGLGDEVKRMAIQFGSDPTAQAGALYEIMAAGVEDAGDAMRYLDVANRLAIGGVTDVETAAGGLVSVMNAWGDTIKSVTDVSDAMFIAAASGSADIEDLTSTIGRVASIAAAAGASFDEVMAAVGALTANAVPTTTAMNGLRAIMAAVLKPTVEATKTAQALGLEFNATALKSKGLAGFLADVAAKTQGSTEQMALLFGGVEALMPVLSLTGEAAAAFARGLDAMANKAGATEAAFQKIASSFSFLFKQIKSAVQATLLDVGQEVLDNIKPAVDYLVEHSEDLRTRIGGALSALVSDMVSAARATGLSFDQAFQAVVSRFVGFIGWVGTFVQSAAYVIAQLPAAVAPLLAAVAGAFMQLSGVIDAASVGMKERIVAMVAGMSERFATLVDWLRETIPAAIAWFRPIWDELVETVKHLADEFLGVSDSAQEFAGGALAKVQAAIITALEWVQTLTKEGLAEQINKWIDIGKIILGAGGALFAINSMANAFLAVKGALDLLGPVLSSRIKQMITLNALRLGVGGAAALAVGGVVYGAHKLRDRNRERLAEETERRIYGESAPRIATPQMSRAAAPAVTQQTIQHSPQLVIGEGAIQVSGVTDPRSVALQIKRELEQMGRETFGSSNAALGLA